MIRVCVAGATGWTGSAVAKAVLDDPELELVGAVARRVAAQDLGATLGIGAVGLLISPTVDYRPPGTSAIAFVLKGPVRTNAPGGSVSYSVV